MAIQPLLGNKYSFITFYIAIALSGWYGGLAPAIVCLILSGLSAAYFFLEPSGTIMITSSADQLGLAVFAVVGFSIGFITDAQRRHERRARIAELTRRTSEETLTTTLKSIGDGVISTDVEGRVAFMNGVAEQLTGWSEKEAKGRQIREVFSIVNERTRSVVENPVDKVIKTGAIVGLANHTVLISRDGIERAIDDSGAPIRYEGRTVGAVLVFRDVTEQRRAADTHARLAAIVESSNDAIIGKRLDGTITSWNPAAERLYGYTAGEAIGKSVTMLVPSGHPEEIPRILDRLSRGETIEQFDALRVTKAGNLVDVRLVISPIKAPDGEIVGAATVAKELSSQKRMEQALLQSEHRLRMALDAAECATWDWDLVNDRVVWSNPGHSIISGARDHVEGPMSAITALIHPDDLPRLNEQADLAVREGSPFNAEFRAIRLSGEVRWIRASGKAVYDSDGKPIRMTGVTIDITDRRVTEEDLRASENRTRSILQSAMDAIMTIDEDQRILLFNEAAERIFLCKAQDAVGRPIDQFIPERFREGHSGHIGRFGETGISSRAMGDLGSLSGLRSDGQEFPIEASISQSESRGTKVYTVILRDISERMMAQELADRHFSEIEALNHRLQRSMSETHHRVKNNLQVIAALVDMQVVQNRSKEVVSVVQLERIGQHIRSFAVIHDLLTRQAKSSAVVEYLSVKDALLQLLPLLNDMLAGRSIVMNVDDVSLPIRLGTSLVVLVNEMVSNSIKHGAGNIEITFDLDGNTARLCVSDQGPGFPVDFEILSKEHTGLELVESLTRWDLNGAVRYSNNTDGGAKVSVEFPVPNGGAPNRANADVAGLPAPQE